MKLANRSIPNSAHAKETAMTSIRLAEDHREKLQGSPSIDTQNPMNHPGSRLESSLEGIRPACHDMIMAFDIRRLDIIFIS